MNTYEESVAWCESYALEHGFKYRAQMDTGEKYFHTMKEAQDFFNNRYENHRAVITPKPAGVFTEFGVQYITVS